MLLKRDPWLTTARLSRLPEAVATRRMAALIAALPDRPSADRDPTTIAARLITHLPPPDPSDFCLSAPWQGVTPATRAKLRLLLSALVFGAVVAAVGLALSGCAIFDGAGDGQKSSVVAPKPNRFEVFFDLNRSDISATSAKILREAADSATRGEVTGITLSVHTDFSGPDAYNRALSARRAAAIKAELIKDGVPADEITSVLVGNAGQPGSTSDGIHEPQSRRTEIILR